MGHPALERLTQSALQVFGNAGQPFKFDDACAVEVVDEDDEFAPVPEKIINYHLFFPKDHF